MRDFKVSSPLHGSTDHFYFKLIQVRIVSSLYAKNVQRMQTDPPAGVSASPVADNVMTWYVFKSKSHHIQYTLTVFP